MKLSTRPKELWAKDSDKFPTIVANRASGKVSTALEATDLMTTRSGNTINLAVKADDAL